MQRDLLVKQKNQERAEVLENFENEMRTSKNGFAGAMMSLEEKLKGMETGTLEKKLSSLKKLHVQLKKESVLDRSPNLIEQIQECEKQIKTLELAQKNKAAIAEPKKEEVKKPQGFLQDLETFAVEDI